MTQDLIPHFDDTTNPMRSDKDTVERNMIQVVLWNRADNTVLLLHWPEFDWKTLILGGVEEGEDMVQAAKREVAEETGYTDIEFVTEICKTKSTFYAAHKGVNRIAHNTGLLFQLVGWSQEPVDPKELAQHTPHWISVTDAKAYINVEAQQYMLDQAFGHMIA